LACANGAVSCQQNVQPVPELCDGQDNDCDGTVDNGNPGGGAACATAEPGLCSAGTLACANGAVSCQPNVQPVPELCDGLDNDCDGQTDEEGVCLLCPSPKGFWKNNPNAWPVASLTLGSQSYTQLELLAILNAQVSTGPKADASLILAHQLIAAKLNIAKGANPAPISETVADADSLLISFSGKLPYKVKTSSHTGQAMVTDARMLERYNKNELTPGCVL
jgi:hypothetical protein